MVTKTHSFINIVSIEEYRIKCGTKCCWQIITFSSIFVLSIFGQFDYKLETRLLKFENRFHAQHLLPLAVDKLTDDHVATIYEAYQTDISSS
jgi:hypothetical protein